MSKPTVASLEARIEAQAARIDALEAQLAKFAQHIAQLQGRTATRPAAKFRSFSERARAYCAEHGVASVPHEVVAQWRAE